MNSILSELLFGRKKIRAEKLNAVVCCVRARVMMFFIQLLRSLSPLENVKLLDRWDHVGARKICRVEQEVGVESKPAVYAALPGFSSVS